MKVVAKKGGTGKTYDCPLSWWKDHADRYPNLAKLAIHFLGIPATQIECERIFSAAGILTNGRRSNTSADLLDLAIGVNQNLPEDEALRWEGWGSTGTESDADDADIASSYDSDLEVFQQDQSEGAVTLNRVRHLQKRERSGLLVLVERCRCTR